MHELTSTGVGSSSVDKKRIILMMEIFKGNGEINGYAVINNKVMQSIESYVLSVHLMYEILFAKQIGQNVKDSLIIPFWDSKDNRQQITAHPLGGCPMGEDAITGVVNSFGQVFRGQSGRNVYENLYVIDDSIIPSPLGVNRQCFIHNP